jgi:hypothetical protein
MPLTASLRAVSMRSSAEGVGAMPSEVALAACHGSPECPAGQVLLNVATSMLGGLDGWIPDEPAVVVNQDVATLEKLVASEPARRHDDVGDIAPLAVAARGPLLNVRRYQELDLEVTAAKVARGGRAGKQRPAQVRLFDPPCDLSCPVQVVQRGYCRGKVIAGWPLLIGRLQPVQDDAWCSLFLHRHSQNGLELVCLARAVARNAQGQPYPLRGVAAFGSVRLLGDPLLGPPISRRRS